MKVVGLVDKVGVLGDWLDTIERRKYQLDLGQSPKILVTGRLVD
jgi:hypothetical protein